MIEDQTVDVDRGVHAAAELGDLGDPAPVHAGLRLVAAPEDALARSDTALLEPANVLVGPAELITRLAEQEVAAAEGMSEGEPSRLEEVKAALLRLGETWRPKPFAPAAAVVPCQQGELELVAA